MRSGHNSQYSHLTRKLIFILHLVMEVEIFNVIPKAKIIRCVTESMKISLNIALAPRADYVLSHNYPNPFNSYTTINFISEGTYPAELVIYDALGRRVKTLFKGTSHYPD